MYKASLARHMANEHSSLPRKVFKCDQCFKEFLTKSGLKDHIVSHNIKFDFSCNICSKSFASQRKLKGHLSIHLEKVLNCDQCSYKCATMRKLRYHKLIHDKLKKHFHCDQCQYTGTTLLILNRHKKTHSRRNLKTSRVLQQYKKILTKTKLGSHKKMSHLRGDKCGKEFKSHQRLFHHQVCQITIEASHSSSIVAENIVKHSGKQDQLQQKPKNFVRSFSIMIEPISRELMKRNFDVYGFDMWS